MIGLPLKPTRLVSLFLSAALALSPAVMAADTEVTLPGSILNESDAPWVVSDEIKGEALGVGTVEATGVNVRRDPNTEAEVLTTIADGDQVIILSKEGDWYRVTVNGVTGFVGSEYMDLSAEGSAELGYGLIKASAANIRVAPDPEADTVECLSEADGITIIGMVDGWYEVQVKDGATGYIRSDLVDPTADVPAQKIFDYAVIGVNAANLRAAPDSSSEKVDMLFADSLCTLIEQIGDWYLVQYGDTQGYIYAPLMSTTNSTYDGSTELETYNQQVEREAREAAAAQKAAAEAAKAAAQRAQEEAAAAQAAAKAAQAQAVTYEEPAYQEPAYEEPVYEEPAYEEPVYEEPAYEEPAYEEPAYEEPVYEEPAYVAPSSYGNAIVDTAMQYLGVPYVWGGTSPSGFDCSGFVQYVFWQNGISLTRTADTQYYDGYAVSYSNLQPGDLVFFAGTYTEGISHVGIYIGDGEMIHAAGACVKITSLSENYYASRYYGACRVG